MFECIKFSTEIRQMVTFSATIRKFGKMGEKTGWVYVEVPAGIDARGTHRDALGQFGVQGQD